MVSVLLLIPILVVGGTIAHRRHVRSLERAFESLLADRTRDLLHSRDEATRRANEIETLDRARTRVLVGMLNELRTPLMMLKSPLHTSMHASSVEEIDDDDIERMIRQANRLQRGVEQIQAILELELGSSTLDYGRHDFVGTMDRLVTSLMPLAERHGVKVSFRSDCVELPFAFDATRIEEAVHSLVERCFTQVSSGDSMRFFISTTPEAPDGFRRVVLEISDNGKPIAEEVLRVMRSKGDWDAFEGTSFDATALGLALARRYAELHGGELEMDVVGERGTRSRLTLPLRTRQEVVSGDGEVRDSTRREITAQLTSGGGIEHRLAAESVKAGPQTVSTGSLASASPQPADSASSQPAESASPRHAAGLSPRQAASLSPRHAERSSPRHADSASSQPADSASSQPADSASSQPADSASSQPADSAAARHAENASSRPNDRDTTVLVVDDHAETRRYLSYALRKYHNVIEATNGAEALEIIRDVDPDLVLSDIMMPVMDGNEMCRRIKSDDSLSHTPVFLVTANTVTDLRKEGLQSGADDYFVKPFDLDEAILRINNEIKTRSELRRRYRREIVMRPSDITVTSADEAFLNKARQAIEDHMDDGLFGVQELASELGLSARQLQRRLRETMDRSPVEFIRTLRLQRAAQLLEAEYGNVSEVAYSVGFTSLSYFAKCFREQFGASPSEYKAKQAA